MKFTIAKPQQQGHVVLRDELRLATQAGGEVGEALSCLMPPGFVKEEQNALPPMGLLAGHLVRLLPCQRAARGIAA